METILGSVLLAPTAAAVAVLAVAGARHCLARVLAPAAKPWAEAAVYLVVAAVAAYLWSRWHLFAWSAHGSCEVLHAVPSAPGGALVHRLSPQHCPHSDPVSEQVQPLLALFLVAATSCAGTALVTHVRDRVRSAVPDSPAALGGIPAPRREPHGGRRLRR